MIKFNRNRGRLCTTEGRHIPMDMSLLFLAFGTALASLLYQFLLASFVARLFHDAIFTYSLVVGIFLLSKGTAVFFYRKKKNPLLRFHFFKTMAILEGLLMFIGGTSVFWCNVVRVLSHDNQLLTCLSAFSVSAFISFLCGLELPLTWSMITPIGNVRERQNLTLLADYFGSAVATVVFPFLLVPFFNLTQIGALIAILNLLLFLICLFRFSPPTVRTVGLTGLIFCLSFAKFSGSIHEKLLMAIYDPLNLNQFVAAFQTHYNDVLVMHRNFEDEKGNIQDHLSLYLNGTPQFIDRAEAVVDPYHQHMVDAALKNRPGVKRVLILGCGTGFLARALLRYPTLQSIQMVDIDGNLASFSKKHPVLAKFNKGALTQSALHLEVSDAFKWVKKSKETFDAIFVDFPEAENLASIRVVSREFFTDLKHLLSPRGMAVIQADYDVPKSYVASIMKSGLQAGLYPTYVYQPPSSEAGSNGWAVSQYLLFNSREEREQSFKEAKLEGPVPPPRGPASDRPASVWIPNRSDTLIQEAKAVSFYDSDLIRKEVVRILGGTPHE